MTIAALPAGFWQFFVPTHLLAVCALGLALGRGARPAVMLAVFALGLLAGSLIIASAVRETPAATALLVIAALAAMTLGLGISVSIVGLARASEYAADEGNVAANQLMVWLAARGEGADPTASAEDLSRLDRSAASVAAAVGGTTTLIPLDVAMSAASTRRAWCPGRPDPGRTQVPMTAHPRLAPAREAVLKAALLARVYEVAQETPLELAPVLSARLRNRVWIKREDEQPVFSFKVRGAYNRMAALTPDELAGGVVTSSAGNHAQGVALSASRPVRFPGPQPRSTTSRGQVASTRPSRSRNGRPRSSA